MSNTATPILLVTTILALSHLTLSSLIMETLNFPEYKYDNIAKFNEEMESYKQFVNIIELTSVYQEVSPGLCGKEDCSYFMYEIVNSELGLTNILKMPTILLFSGMNGAETLGINTLLHMIRTMVNGAYFSQDWYSVLNSVRLLVIPVANPSGFFNGDEYERIYARSKTDRADPRIDFNWKTKKSCFVTATAQLLFHLHQDFLITASLEVGSGLNTIFYPTASTKGKTVENHPEKKVYEEIANLMNLAGQASRKLEKIGSTYKVIFKKYAKNMHDSESLLVHTSLLKIYFKISNHASLYLCILHYILSEITIPKSNSSKPTNYQQTPIPNTRSKTFPTTKAEKTENTLCGQPTAQLTPPT